MVLWLKFDLHAQTHSNKKKTYQEPYRHIQIEELYRTQKGSARTMLIV